MVLLVSQPAGAEVLNCDRLSGNQRAVCVDLALCTRIGDQMARSQCFSAVLVSGRKQAVAGQSASGSISAEAGATEVITTEAISSEAPAAASGEELRVVRVAPKTAATPTVVTAAVVNEEDSYRMPVITKRKAQDDAGESLPRRFSAKILKVRELVRNRQIVLLDNDLLFEGEGLFKEGYEVNVTKARFSKRYTITHVKGSSHPFKRLPCELSDKDLNDDTVRKCAAFFDISS
jgi:hypothetical protein